MNWNACNPEIENKSRRVVSPRAEIIEKDAGTYVLVAEMPGLDKDSANVRVEDHKLILEGRTKAIGDWAEKLDREYRREFVLSDAVNTAGITAELKDGMLYVELPKAEHMKPRKVDVRVM
jgi:HSP20 family molecular chaperone IbpA